jgi:hypothetical protein
MFTWFRERKKFEKDTRLMLRAMELWIGDLQKAKWDLESRVKELEKVQRTLCDDMYDIQADMTLIHNIEGYEEWRTDIGKPIKPVIEEEWWEQNKPRSKPTDLVK